MGQNAAEGATCHGAMQWMELPRNAPHRCDETTMRMAKYEMCPGALPRPTLQAMPAALHRIHCRPQPRRPVPTRSGSNNAHWRGSWRMWPPMEAHRAGGEGATSSPVGTETTRSLVTVRQTWNNIVIQTMFVSGLGRNLFRHAVGSQSPPAITGTMVRRNRRQSYVASWGGSTWAVQGQE